MGLIADCNFTDFRLVLEETIEFGKKAIVDNSEKLPLVGSSLVINNSIKYFSFSGEKDPSAIVGLLDKAKEDNKLDHYTLVSTVEPTVEESNIIIDKGIRNLCFGILNPQHETVGEGILQLVLGNVKVENFGIPEITKSILDQNSESVRYYTQAYNRESKSIYELPYKLSPHLRRLDDWYTLNNRIYFDKNHTKSPTEVLTHLVEIVGGLSVLTTEKEKIVDPEGQIAKAIAWWFALCGKMGIRSVETLLFTKFPLICPYCEQSPTVAKYMMERRAIQQKR